VFPRRITPAPHLGIRGVDPHLGQKPKLGGGTPIAHSSTYHILSDICISIFSLSFRFAFLLFLYLFLFLFAFSFQNTKRTKIFLLFLFICFFGFSAFGLPYLLVASCYLKTQKDFDLFATLVGSCFKSKNQKKNILLRHFF